jgi:hypothetical protein
VLERGAADAELDEVEPVDQKLSRSRQVANVVVESVDVPNADR